MDNRRAYISAWAGNMSVAMIVVGGFQENLPLKWRILALGWAVVSFGLGLYLARKGGK